MTFAGVLLALATNPETQAFRTGWNGPGQYVMCQKPDEHSKMSAPYLYLTNVEGKRVPWTPSQGDLFALDWVL